MKARIALALTLGLTLASAASAQTVIVNDNFDSYADRNAFLAKWVPATGPPLRMLSSASSKIRE